MAERIVLAEDDVALRELLDEILTDAGYEVRSFPSGSIAVEAMRSGLDADLVITDLMMPGMGGQDLLRRVRELWPAVNVVVITAFGSIDSAIELVKAGAHDYLTKPFGSDDLLLTVQRALEESRPSRELAAARRSMQQTPEGFVGASRPMQELYRLIARAADSRAPVLITGETGSGKEGVARALHRGPADGFIAVNCAALPEQLLESELFGHARGAFTGAERDRPGLVEAARGGTLFLDEIGEMPSSLQPKLLRVIEDGQVRRLGETAARAVELRIVAATNRSLDDEVRSGRFREDLFWRLNVITLEVPPLRDRPADIPLLAEHFAAGRLVSPAAMALLTAYSWPGNVRELRNAVERAKAMSDGGEIGPMDLPERIRESETSGTLLAAALERGLPLRELERQYILETLRQVGGNKSRAAAQLGLDRKTLYRKLEEYGREES